MEANPLASMRGRHGGLEDFGLGCKRREGLAFGNTDEGESRCWSTSSMSLPRIDLQVVPFAGGACSASSPWLARSA